MIRIFMRLVTIATVLAWAFLAATVVEMLWKPFHFATCDVRVDSGEWRACLVKKIHEDSLGGDYSQIVLGRRWRFGLYLQPGGWNARDITGASLEGREVDFNFDTQGLIVTVDGKSESYRVPQDFLGDNKLASW